MNNNDYNVDDILEELRQRRDDAPANEEAEVENADNNAAETDSAPQKETNTDDTNVPQPQKDVAEDMGQATSTGADDADSVSQEEKSADEDKEPSTSMGADDAGSVSQEEKNADEDKEPSTSMGADDAGSVSQEENMMNIVALADTGSLPQLEEEEETPEPKKARAPMSKKKKTVMRALIILLSLLIVAFVAAFAIANNMLNDLIDNNKDNTVATTEVMWTGMDTLEERFDPIEETEATELASLQDMIREWYYNGTPCQSTHVLNVLLIGEDTRGKEILDEGTRADSAIIVSVNIDTKTITLTSILRDAWAYWETEKGNADTGQFGKINGAMSTGDINAYIRCLENLYKIQIDNYAIVNFDSFETIVDTLGGVTLELTEAEINEINNHQKRYGNVTIEKEFEGNKGEQKLNGKQALAYCRIRKLDSDNMRADRQKTCLIQIFNQTKNASTVKLLKIVKTLIPYVKTSFGKSEIVKIAKYAFTQGWLDFDTYMQNLPESNLKGGTYYGQWVWRPDYPADAYNLQMIVYGKSNITLARIRPDTAKCPERGFYSEGSSAMYSTITNNHYGEVTVVETTTKKDDE